MDSGQNVTANLGGTGAGLLESPSDEDSVGSCDDALLASDQSHFGSISVHSLDPDSIEDTPDDPFGDQLQQDVRDEGVDMADETIEMEVELGGGETNADTADIGEVGGGDYVPKGRSIAHHLLHNQLSVFMSFDIETAGEIAGIVQISAELVRMKMDGTKVGSDRADGIDRVRETFNSYVNPEVRPEYWDQRSITVHGILPDDERIVNAGNMRTVWPEFQRWFHSIVRPSETAILVAWNGEACDLKWLWRLTQAPNSRYSLPANIKYFIDPYRVIEKYKSCHFNKAKSKIEAYELGVVWKYANNGTNLSGAHDSLVDVKAQTDILIHRSFVSICSNFFIILTMYPTSKPT